MYKIIAEADVKDDVDFAEAHDALQAFMDSHFGESVVYLSIVDADCDPEGE